MLTSTIMRCMAALLLVSFTTALRSQTTPPEEVTTEADIRFFSWSVGTKAGALGDVIEEANAEFRVFMDGQLMPLSLPSGRVSDPLIYKGSPRFRIYPSWVATPELAETTPPLWSFSMPANVDSLIIMVIPKNREKSAFEFRPLDTSISRIPLGHILFENVGQRPLAAKLNNLLKPIPAQGAYLLNMDEINSPFLAIQVAAQHESGWEKVVETKRRINPRQRYLMLVHPNVNSKSYGMVPMILKEL